MPESDMASNGDVQSSRPLPTGEGTTNAGDLAPHGEAGDSIRVGDIVQARGVAVGPGASVTIHEAEQAFDVAGLPNPYLGLQPFTYAERTRYAGRDKVVQQAVDLLIAPGAARTLLFVTGASGSGKSSFAQAGLLPALGAHYGARGLTIRHAVIRPSRYPLASLQDALAQLRLPAATARTEVIPTEIMRVLEMHTPPAHCNVIIVDQFEELFTQSEEVQRDSFFAFFAALPPSAEFRTHVVATLRSDYLPELFERKPLYDVAKQGIDLRAMDEDELRDAMLRPLQQYQAEGRVPAQKRFEDALIARLAHDAAGEAAYLPLLQMTLEALWKAGSVRLSAYEHPGGDSRLSAAIRERAEEVYQFQPDHGQGRQPRPEAGQQLILALLLDLVEVALDDDARRDVRRRRTYAELAQESAARAWLIHELVQARLLSRTIETRGDHAVGIDVVDVIHESLIHNWPRLREAMQAQRQLLRQRVRFRQALEEWLAHGRSDAALLGNVRLAEALDLDKRGDIELRNADARELVQRSVAQREAARERELAQAQALAAEQRHRAEEQAKAARRLRTRLWIAVTFAGLALVAAIGAAYGLSQANALRRIAQRQERIAFGRQLAAQAGPLITTYPQRSLLLLIEAVNATVRADEPVVPAAEEALRQALASTGGLVLSGHEGTINAVAISADNHWLVTGSLDTTARLWDLTAENPSTAARVLEGHEGTIWAVAISADNHWLVTGSGDTTARLWNLRLNELVDQACRTVGRNFTLVECSNTSAASRTAKVAPASRRVRPSSARRQQRPRRREVFEVPRASELLVRHQKRSVPQRDVGGESRTGAGLSG